MPLPMCDTVPLPLMAPAKVEASDRLKASAPLSTTLPTMLPLEPPAPNCRVPALMNVPPV